MPSRREFLAGLSASGVITLSGCSTNSDSKSNHQLITLSAIDILNRRETEQSYQIAVQRDDDVVLAESRTIEGATNSSQPTGHSYDDWSSNKYNYKFSFMVESDSSWLRITPEELGIQREGDNCVRAVFVINLGGRVTGHARQPCIGI